MLNKGIFCISLDFELHWGCFERMELNPQQQQYFLNTREVIPAKLNLFAANDIHVTWAIVGMMYCKNVEEWKKANPKIIPTFSNEKASAYKWIEKHGFKGEEDPFHFAPQLIELVKNTPHQEIASHTYAHYFCLEPGQTASQFRDDMRISIELANSNGSEIKSLVFPRNQYNPDYLSVCHDLGITSVRSSPDIWYWRYGTGSTMREKFFRAGDAYLKIHPIKPVYLKDIEVKENSPLLLPSTRLYRAWSPKYKIQNLFKMRRIKDEMTTAAKNKAYYHMWWHPHNFGSNPKECMLELEEIIEHFLKLKRIYGFESMTMNEISDFIRSSKK